VKQRRIAVAAAGCFVISMHAVFIAPAIASLAMSSSACPSPCLSADNDAFTGVATGETDDVDSDGVAAVDPAARVPSTTWTEKHYVPTCTGNNPADNGLCNTAVETCPDGEVRFWVFTREVTIATGDRSEWQRAQGTICLAPDDADIDPAVAIPAMIQRDFQRVVVVKGVAEMSPRPDTLVNIPTVFSTRTPAEYEIPLTLLGQSVVITAKAERYTWHFGDGKSESTTVRGGRVEHELPAQRLP